MSRKVFTALGAMAAGCGLAVVAGGAVGPAPALAAAALSAAARAPRVVAASGVPNPVPVTPTSPSQQSSCQDNPPSIQADTASVTSTPWAQDALDFASVWGLTKGQGVTVGVIDSGVDYTPELAGRVRAIDVTGSGIADCVGHGTAVAGIIAASDEQAAGSSFNPFAGVAPDADILSVKVADTDQTSSINPQLSGDSATLSQGIIDAVDLGATVLNISIVTSNSAQLENAIQFAESHNVVVVAAGGNDYAGGPKGPFYPASYPGVISVGAVASDGSQATFADPNTQESVTAPGVDVTSTEPGGFNDQLLGTSFATPFVAGVAALVRSYYGSSLSAAQVVARIEATADGPTGPVTGNGMVNPLQAVQAILPLTVNPNASSGSGNLRPVPVSRPVSADQGTINAAMGTTAGAVSAAAIVAIGGVSISQRRRRRRGKAAPSPEPKVPADAGLADSPLWE
jgi:membrane-anchored mycosin MYCP